MASPRDPLDSGAGCPCGSGKPFGACCEPLLNDFRPATTARELMRSRYTAHVLGDEAYLHRTFASTAGKPFAPARRPAARTAWVRLQIHRDETGPAPDIACVEFSAYFRDGAAEREMRERSEFRRVDGRWLYTRAVKPSS